MKPHQQIAGILFSAGMIAILTSAAMQASRPPMADVQLDKMNVVYVGVDNPFTVRVDGVSPSKIQVLIQSGSGTILPAAKPGGYILRVSGGTKISLTVNDTSGGRSRQCGWCEYRIKRMPDPRVYIGRIDKDTTMRNAELEAATSVRAVMYNFDFDVRYIVDSFKVSAMQGSQWKTWTAQGSNTSAEMRSAFHNARSGDRIIFHDIMVKGPDGIIRKLSGPVVTIE